MKCCKCKALATDGYEYPEEYCSIGVPDDDTYEDKDGNWGCKLHPATIKRMIKENEEALAKSYECW